MPVKPAPDPRRSARCLEDEWVPTGCGENSGGDRHSTTPRNAVIVPSALRSSYLATSDRVAQSAICGVSVVHHGTDSSLPGSMVGRGVSQKTVKHAAGLGEDSLRVVRWRVTTEQETRADSEFAVVHGEKHGGGETKDAEARPGRLPIISSLPLSNALDANSTKL
ncbi:hypothetical protein C8R44DRAFT_741893 [Mycena epipterygia]|nr:hypothetical protein C8R44DRAFT_741893 [Mycena epipterygia]